MGREAFDVVVVGAGSVGTSAALALAEVGLDVLVLDVRPSVGQGSNKAAIGGVRATHSDPAKIRSAAARSRSPPPGRRLTGRTSSGGAGYVFVAYTPREERTLKDLLVVQHRYGLEIDWLDARELLALVPDLNPRGLLGWAYAPGDGHLSPLLCHAMNEEARRAGAEFHFRERVTGIEAPEGRVRAGVTDKSRYGTKVVLNAAGAWAAAVGRLVGEDHPVLPDSHEAGVTKPVAHFLDPMIVDIRRAPGSSNYYFHQLASGQFTFCISPDPRSWGRTAGRRARSCRWWRGGWWTSCRAWRTSGCGEPGAVSTR
jgi:sarcosine oxidase subunit beta